MYPVPPPGSCLLPPPPLPPWTNHTSGAVTENSQLVIPTLQSLDQEVDGQQTSITPTVPYYNYQKSKPMSSRTRTLLEVPLIESSSQGKNFSSDTTKSSLLQTSLSKSRLDPTCQPFKPTSLKITGFSQRCDVDKGNSPNMSSDASHLLNDFFKEDPLPSSPSILLPPDLDATTDDQDMLLRPIRLRNPVLPMNPAEPPLILPLTSHWSGSLRPPLLPTPPNFPQFGPALGQGLDVSSEIKPAHPALSNPSSKRNIVGMLGSQMSAKEDRGPLRLVGLEASEWDPELPASLPDNLLASSPVPAEYLVGRLVRNKLPPLKLSKCHTDLLFFLFSCLSSDLCQLSAARLLFERGWRYHRLSGVWVALWPGVQPQQKGEEWEEGLYQYFDTTQWKRLPGWFRLNYSQLAEKPSSEDNIPGTDQGRDAGSHWKPN